MRKCHYIYDKEAGKVLIPGCWSVVHSNDMSDCTCREFTETFKQFERQEYNKTLKEKSEYIKELEKENTRLMIVNRKKTHVFQPWEYVNRILRKVDGFR